MANKWYRFIVSKSNFNSQNNRRFLSRNGRKTQDIFFALQSIKIRCRTDGLEQNRNLCVKSYNCVYLFLHGKKAGHPFAWEIKLLEFYFIFSC